MDIEGKNEFEAGSEDVLCIYVRKRCIRKMENIAYTIQSGTYK